MFRKDISERAAWQTELETVSEVFVWKIAKETMTKNKLQVFTKYLRLTLVFMRNSALRKSLISIF